VGFSPDEEEKSSTSLGNKIYRNDIPRRNSINHTKGHKSKQFYSKKQETDGRIEMCSSRLTSKRTRLNISPIPPVISCDFRNLTCTTIWMAHSETPFIILALACIMTGTEASVADFMLCLIPSRSEIYG